ncbi:MAG: hypothetical protein U9N14_04605, partial [Pseudomonadota bacterium]|nr:hypothetical protein [Pseudomonadota bacterium]
LSSEPLIMSPIQPTSKRVIGFRSCSPDKMKRVLFDGSFGFDLGDFDDIIDRTIEGAIDKAERIVCNEARDLWREQVEKPLGVDELADLTRGARRDYERLPGTRPLGHASIPDVKWDPSISVFEEEDWLIDGRYLMMRPSDAAMGLTRDAKDAARGKVPLLDLFR